MSRIRSQQDLSCNHASTRGSTHAVRRIPYQTIVVPCSATLVSVTEDIASEDVDVCCEESEIGVDMPGVVSSAALECVSEQPAMEVMDVCEEFAHIVDTPAAVPSGCTAI